MRIELEAGVGQLSGFVSGELQQTLTGGLGEGAGGRRPVAGAFKLPGDLRRIAVLGLEGPGQQLVEPAPLGPVEAARPPPRR